MTKNSVLKSKRLKLHRKYDSVLCAIVPVKNDRNFNVCSHKIFLEVCKYCTETRPKNRSS